MSNSSWIWVWTVSGQNRLINLATVALITEGAGNQAVIEWLDGNMQVTITDPTFSDLQKMLVGL